MKYCSINGETATTLEVTDRGLAYGDGLFTTAKIMDGKVELVDAHIQRLVEGCHKLMISLPASLSQGTFKTELNTIAKNYTVAVLKVLITPGSGGRGYSRIGLSEHNTNIIIQVFDYPENYNVLAQSGIVLGISKQKIAISPMLSGIKHLNRLEQVLLRRELDSRTEDDLIALNVNNHVIEATSANIFYWLDNKLYTPDVSVSGVDGLMRQFIIANYPKYYGSKVNIVKASLDQLEQASAIFICNSVTGVMPVNKFNERILNLKAACELRIKVEELIRD